VEALEVRIDEYRVVAFDGRVLEFFGADEGRFHVDLLSVTVADPDKKGNRSVKVEDAHSQMTIGPLGGLDEASFQRLRPVLDALKVAGASVVER